jgi:hypothetical protein
MLVIHVWHVQLATINHIQVLVSVNCAHKVDFQLQHHQHVHYVPRVTLPFDVFSYIDQHDALALFHVGVWHNTNIGTYGSTLGLNTPLCTGECPAGYYCESGSIDATETPCPVCCSHSHRSSFIFFIMIMTIY